jgi:hypothetical protein
MSPRRAARAATKSSRFATSKGVTRVKFAPQLLRVVFVLWAGSLWSLAAWVAPTLFSAQADRHLAGVLAARLFSIETYVALGVAVLALISAARARFRWAYLATALLSINEWLLKPLLNQAHAAGHAWGLGFVAWHGISATLYVGACVLVLLLVWNDDLR